MNKNSSSTEHQTERTGNTRRLPCFFPPTNLSIVLVAGALLNTTLTPSALAEPPNKSDAVYVVRKGDTFSAIARRYEVSAKALLDANLKVKDPDQIQVGEKLNLPPPGTDLIPRKIDPFRSVDKTKSDAELVATLTANEYDANQCRDGEPLLCHVLAKKRGIEVVRVLVKRGADVNATNIMGRTVLMVGLENGCGSNIVSVLVKSGADCNAREPTTGKTPLMFAVDNYADENTVKVLCESGKANVLALDCDGRDLSRYLSFWSPSRQKRKLGFLFKKLDDAIAAQDNTMRSISWETDPQRVNSRVRLESDWRATDSMGRTLLMLIAANNRNAEVVELALQNGCSVLDQDKYGWKAADFAVAQNGKLEIVQRLVVEEMLLLDTEKGSKDYQKRIDELQTKVSGGNGSVSGPRRNRDKAAIATYAYAYALGFPTESSLPLLSLALASSSAVLAFTDAHVERIDELLAVAASNTKNTDVLDFLLAQNAKINGTDDFGITPLMCAVANNPEPQIALHLLQKGANPTAYTVKELETKDRSSYLGWTVFETNGTSDGGRIPEEKILKHTPVCMFACMSDSPLVTLNALIANGADTKAHDVEGTTCLMLACKHSRNPELVLWLLNPDLSSPELKSENGKGPKAWSFWRENKWLENDKRIERKFSEFQNYK